MPIYVKCSDSQTLGFQMFFDYNSQKSWPAQLVVKASGSFSPRISGDPRLGTSALICAKLLYKGGCRAVLSYFINESWHGRVDRVLAEDSGDHIPAHSWKLTGEW